MGPWVSSYRLKRVWSNQGGVFPSIPGAPHRLCHKKKWPHLMTAKGAPGPARSSILAGQLSLFRPLSTSHQLTVTLWGVTPDALCSADTGIVLRAQDVASLTLVFSQRAHAGGVKQHLGMLHLVGNAAVHLWGKRRSMNNKACEQQASLSQRWNPVV